MNISRRTFLKIVGVSPIAASVPFSVLSEEAVSASTESFTANITVTNLPIGAQVGIFTADTMEQIFVGEATSETVKAHYETAEDTDIIVRVKMHDFIPFQSYGTLSKNLSIHTTQVRDEIYRLPD